MKFIETVTLVRGSWCKKTKKKRNSRYVSHETIGFILKKNTKEDDIERTI